MGFYGNITNTNKTQFTFDRSYSSRALMDQRIDRDGIYLGRYVLVEYSLDTSKDMYYLAFKKGDKFYAAADFDPRTELKYTDNPYAITTKVTNENNSTICVTTGQVIRTQENRALNNETTEILTDVFYKCIGGNEDNVALFEELTASNDHYTANYGIDKALYKTENYNQGRGYDSTVWQKVYVGEDEKYVMIAELNTVVPTFELSIDAPAMVPITPHFGTDSTNLNYKLHWQPQWGLRVGKPNDDQPNSDADIIYYTSEYNSETGEIKYEDYEGNEIDISKINKSIGPGAIYFNKAALSSQIHKPNEEMTLVRHVEGKNYFTILPVSSGKKYNIHDSTLSDTINDTYEMRVNLPAIGNMVSSGWDALIGEDRLGNFTTDTNSISWLKNNLEDQILSLQALISGGVKDGLIMTDGSGNVLPGYLNGQSEPPAANTTWKPGNNDRVFAKDSWIYAAFSDEYEIVKVMVPVVDENGVIQKDDNGNIITEEKEIQAGGLNLYHNFTSVDNTESNKDILVANNSFALDIPIVDATGHVVGYDVTTFSLPKIECDGKWLTKTVNENTNTITISHTVETQDTPINYNDVTEGFYVISKIDNNHVTEVINVKKDDFSLYWKGMTD